MMATSNQIVLQVPNPQSGGQVQQVVLPGGQHAAGQPQTIVIPMQQAGGQQQQIVIPAQQAGGQPQHVIINPQPKPCSHNFNPKAGLVIGMIMLGIVLVEIVSTSLALSGRTEYRGAVGIWASILIYAVTGLLGIFTRRDNRGIVISYLVFCLLSILVAFVNMVYDSTAADHKGRVKCEDRFEWYNYSDSELQHYCDTHNFVSKTHTVAAAFAAGQILIAIIGSCFGCCGLCDCCYRYDCDCCVKNKPLGSTSCSSCCDTKSTSPSQTAGTGQQMIVIYQQPNQQVQLASTSSYSAAGPSTHQMQQQKPYEPPIPQDPPPAYEECIATAPPDENPG